MKREEWDKLQGYEQLEVIGRVLRNTRTDCLYGFSADAVVKIVSSCILSDWDVVPSDLTMVELDYAQCNLMWLLNESLAKRLG